MKVTYAAFILVFYWGQCFSTTPEFVVFNEERQPCLLANLHFLLTIPYVTTSGHVETVTVMPQSWVKNENITFSGACEWQRYTADGLSQMHDGPILVLKWNWPESSRRESPNLHRNGYIYVTSNDSPQKPRQSPNSLYIHFKVENNVTSLSKVDAIIYTSEEKLFPDAQNTDYPVKVTGDFSSIQWPSSSSSYKCNQIFVSENESKYGEKIILLDMQFQVGISLLRTFDDPLLCNSLNSYKKVLPPPPPARRPSENISISPAPLSPMSVEDFEEETVRIPGKSSFIYKINNQLLEKLDKSRVLVCEGCAINFK